MELESFTLHRSVTVCYLRTTWQVRGVLTFLYYSDSRRHSFSIHIPFEKQPLAGYPTNPVTIGDHIRKRRMDLGLLQREVAEIIGVTESSIWNWEHGTEPEL